MGQLQNGAALRLHNMNIREFFPKLMVDITRNGRVLVSPGNGFEWSKNCWTHNAFRAYEMIFGAPYGVRPSIASWIDENGISQQRGFTLEATLAIAEGKLRKLFKALQTIRLTIPVMQTSIGVPIFASPYVFAIAFDAAAGVQNYGANTPLSQTCTGSNGYLEVFMTGNAADTLSSITYNLVSMTPITKIRYPSDFWNYVYGLIAPTTGTNNVIETGVVNSGMGAISYTGCKQSSQPDSSNTVDHSGSSTTLVQLPTTVVATNCWLTGYAYAPGGFVSSGGSAVRGASPFGAGMFDSNATVGTGSQTLAVTITNNAYIGLVTSIAPIGATVNSGFLMFM